MSTLTQFRTRIAQTLVDVSNVNYATGALDEALRTALHEYTLVAPLTAESLLTLPGVGRTIALDSLTALIAVQEIWWPYDSLEDDDTNQAANLVIGFRLRFDNALPVILITTAHNEQPQVDDEIYVWWTQPATIQDLDSAAATTLPTAHESGLVIGASAYAAISRSIDRVDEFNLDPRNPNNLHGWGAAQLNRFQLWLTRFKAASPRAPAATYGHPWRLDKWDS